VKSIAIARPPALTLTPLPLSLSQYWREGEGRSVAGSSGTAPGYRACLAAPAAWPHPLPLSTAWRGELGTGAGDLLRPAFSLNPSAIDLPFPQDWGKGLGDGGR